MATLNSTPDPNGLMLLHIFDLRPYRHSDHVQDRRSTEHHRNQLETADVLMAMSGHCGPALQSYAKDLSNGHVDGATIHLFEAGQGQLMMRRPSAPSGLATPPWKAGRPIPAVHQALPKTLKVLGGAIGRNVADQQETTVYSQMRRNRQHALGNVRKLGTFGPLVSLGMEPDVNVTLGVQKMIVARSLIQDAGRR